MQFQAPTSKSGWRRVISATKYSMWIAAVVLLWDVGMEGFYGCSILVCPPWFVISCVKNLIQRPGWGIASVRLSMPLLTFAIAVSNGSVQWKNSDINAERVIKACDEFHAANGRYPQKLDELVPTYLASIPPAKHCAMGEFYYHRSDDSALLWWSRYGFYRRFYDFNERRWSNLD